MRSGLGNKLVLVPPSSSGYSVCHLRDRGGLELGQALAYIRPLQEKLDLTAIDIVAVSTLFIVALRGGQLDILKGE